MAKTRFIWDPVSDSVLQEKDANTGVTQVTYTNETSPYGPLRSERRGTETRQYHFDALGSTRALTDDSQTVTDTFAYDAWGGTTQLSGVMPVAHAWAGCFGYHSNPHHLQVHVRSREYFPGLASWSSPDPLGTLLSDHPYVYARNQPVSLIDPSGAVPTGVYRGRDPRSGLSDPPNLNALFALDGFAPNKLHLQYSYMVVTYKCKEQGCCPSQNFRYVAFILDMIQVGNPHVVADTHQLSIQQICNLGPGASACCKEGEYGAITASEIMASNKPWQRGQDYAQQFSDVGYKATKCCTVPEEWEDLAPPLQQATRVLRRLLDPNVGLKFSTILNQVDETNGTFVVAGGCTLTSINPFRHPNYTGGGLGVL